MRRVIVSASSLVIADCDTGFCETRNLSRTVKELEHAGVARIWIEAAQSGAAEYVAEQLLTGT